MHPFEEYLHRNHLEPLTVAIAAKVRYLAVWNATKGNPISSEQAQKILQAIASKTGIAYTGPLAVYPLAEQPTLPIPIFANHRSI